MNREEFKKILEENQYSFYEADERIIINHNGDLWRLRRIESIPEKVTFKNKGNVNLDYLTKLPEETIFHNKGHVTLNSLGTSGFSKGVRFNQSAKAYFKFNKFYNSESGYPIKGIKTNIIFNSLIKTIWG